jgi:hypothetical protein
MYLVPRPPPNRFQEEVSRTFRSVIGVSGKIYPDLTIERVNPVTEEIYLNPAFEATVKHPGNHFLFIEVATQIEQQLAGVSALACSLES